LLAELRREHTKCDFYFSKILSHPSPPTFLGLSRLNPICFRPKTRHFSLSSLSFLFSPSPFSSFSRLNPKNIGKNVFSRDDYPYELWLTASGARRLQG